VCRTDTSGNKLKTASGPDPEALLLEDWVTTSLRVEPYNIPAADLGPENPLPAFRNPVEDSSIDFDKQQIPEDGRIGLGWKTGRRVLPYRMQDGYGRTRNPRDFTSLVLENEFLKVRVLPEVGALVTSIVWKPLNRELLVCNPVFQPANFALRNAWVAGGIEWNTAQVGHHYLTMSPFHAARITGPDGEPGLRLYAWERVKCFPFHIDLFLPPKSKFLFARVRLINPHPYEIPMYWWTNIGVPEYPDGRVIVPAEYAFKGLYYDKCPTYDGLDYSYATHINNAYDLFFHIPDEQRKWEVIVDKDGAGMVHASTPRLKGRKMFVWGMGDGSRRFNDFLGVKDTPFQEIQAGLAYTQAHSIPMPAQTEWTWTEAMSFFEADPSKLHSTDWNEACDEAGRALESMITQSEIDEWDRKFAEVAARPPDEMLFAGLGWGALEKKRAESSGEKPTIPDAMPYDDSDLGPEQQPWLELLHAGALPEPDPQADPGQYMIQPEWRALLEESIRNGKGDHWYSWLHLGVAMLECHEEAQAEAAWKKSFSLKPSAWALRNLAVVAWKKRDFARSCDLLKKAWEIGPKIWPIAHEYGTQFLERKHFDELDEFLKGLPEDVCQQERIRMLAATTALRFDRFDEVEQLLAGDFATIQEGELSLSEIWYSLQEKKIARSVGVEVTKELKDWVRKELEPPYEIDFRMYTTPDAKYVAPQAE